MHLPRAAALADLVILDEVGSTNDELVARSAGAAEFTVVLTTSQTSGRGRLGRTWIAPPGEGLAMSVLLRPRLPGGGPLDLDRWGWIPLIAGVAMTRALSALLPGADAWLKWPNDVLVHGSKVSGILAELLPAADGLVLGMGVNLLIPADRLPTPVSTSLAIEGVADSGEALVDDVCAGWLAEFRPLYAEFLRSGGDETTSGIRQSVLETCSTVGQRVNVHLPGAENMPGTAIDVDGTGRLVVRRDADGGVQAVAAGDVTHLRYE